MRQLHQPEETTLAPPLHRHHRPIRDVGQDRRLIESPPTGVHRGPIPRRRFQRKIFPLSKPNEEQEMRIKDMKVGVKVRLSNLFRNTTVKWSDADLDAVGTITEMIESDLARVAFDPPLVNEMGDVIPELVLSKNYLTKS